MGLSRNKVAVSEGAAGSPPFYGERVRGQKTLLRKRFTDDDERRHKLVLFNFQGSRETLKSWCYYAEGPPVPIPNTEVKLCSGENTLLEAAREDSSMPTQRREQRDLLSALKRTECEEPH